MRATIMVVRFSLVQLKPLAATDAPAAWFHGLRERVPLGWFLRLGLRQLRQAFHGVVVVEPQPFPNREPSSMGHTRHACVTPAGQKSLSAQSPWKMPTPCLQWLVTCCS
jgi:hypothetical protein